jgi:hypothetical protein
MSQSNRKVIGATATNGGEAATDYQPDRRSADEQAQHAGAVERETGCDLLQPEVIIRSQAQREIAGSIAHRSISHSSRV